MSTALYRAYHVKRAKGGVALIMTAGSATVSRDSPPVFNNLLAYKDWLPVVSPSLNREAGTLCIPKRLEHWDEAFQE